MVNLTKKEKLKKLLEIVKSNKLTPDKLKEVLALLNDGLSKDEFIKSFKKITEHTLRTEIKLVEKVNKAIAELKGANSTSLEATQATLRAVADRFEVSLNKALKDQENSLNFIRDKVRKIKDGEDGKSIEGKPGKDADEEKIIQKVLDKIPDHSINVESNSEDILKLREDLARNKRLKGGGTSAAGVAQTFKYIAHTEKPVGLINGTNKVFTVAKNIWWVAGFTISNQQIAELPNFTYVGKTITFASAIPAAYSTRDFEIKYIG